MLEMNFENRISFSDKRGTSLRNVIIKKNIISAYHSNYGNAKLWIMKGITHTVVSKL